jgi:hypothetical protein
VDEWLSLAHLLVVAGEPGRQRSAGNGGAGEP